MTNSTDTKMAAAMPDKLPPTQQTSISKDGKWKTFHKHAGLMQYVPSGMFFARTKVNGIVRRASLDTDVFSTAKDKLSGKVSELHEPPAVLGTFAEARLRYMEDVDSNHALAPKTKGYWHQRMDTLLKSWPGLDKLKLDDITEPMCRKWGKKFAEEYKAITFNNTLSLLRNILTHAKIKHDKNPAMNLKRLGVKPKQMTLPEPEQFDAIVKTVREAGARQSQDCGDLIQFLSFSGCRISEAKQVLWQDVDFARGEIRVRNAKRSKTTSAHDSRFVPIIPAMRELLERLQTKHSPKPTDRVCVLGECQNSLTNACKKNEASRITHHDLRHLFATRCIEAGVDIPTVSRWLGHVDGGALAMKVYGHLRRSHSQQAAQRVTFGATVLIPEIVQPKQLAEGAGVTV